DSDARARKCQAARAPSVGNQGVPEVPARPVQGRSEVRLGCTRRTARRSPDGRPMPILPPELDRCFRLVAFDWDGTAVASRAADATRVVGLLDQLLAAGARIVVITGTSYENVARQLGRGIAPAHAHRLFCCTNRGSEVFGFDRRGAPVLLHRRVASPEEERLL